MRPAIAIRLLLIMQLCKHVGPNLFFQHWADGSTAQPSSCLCVLIMIMQACVCGCFPFPHTHTCFHRKALPLYMPPPCFGVRDAMQLCAFAAAPLPSQIPARGDPCSWEHQQLICWLHEWAPRSPSCSAMHTRVLLHRHPAAQQAPERMHHPRSGSATLYAYYMAVCLRSPHSHPINHISHPAWSLCHRMITRPLRPPITRVKRRVGP